MNQNQRERKRERNRNMKETRAVVERRDDNVREKFMPGVTIRFILCFVNCDRHPESGNLKSL